MNREVVGELISVARLDTTAATKEARAWADRLRAVEAETRKVADANKFVGASADKLRSEMLRLRKEEAAGTIDKKALAQQTKALRIGLTEQAEAARKLKDESKRLREEEKRLRDEMKQTAKAAADAAKIRMQAARETAKAETAAARATTKALNEEARTRISAAKEAARAEAAAMRNAARASTTSAREAARAEVTAIRETARAAKDAASIPGLRARNDAMAHQERGNWRKMQASGDRVGGLTSSIAASNARLAGLQGPFGGIRTAISDRATSFRKSVTDDPSAFASSAFSQAGTGLGKVARTGAGLAMGGLGAAVGIGGAIASKGSDFEALRVSLETVEGSAAKAASTFKLIQSFAAQTPYGVEETTSALVKLKVRGLDASLPALKSYGDMASAMGHSIGDMVDAVAAASVGEFDPLKKFGVSAKVDGDMIKATFNNVTTTIGRDGKSIEKYLQNISKTNFAGGMERQAKTLKGTLSTLSDGISQMADTAFQNGLGAALKDIVADMTGATEGGEEFAKMLGRTLGDAAKEAYKFVKDLIGPVDELPGKLESAAQFAGTVASGLKTVAGMATSVVGAIGPANAAFIAMGVAATAALGPIGLLLVAGVGLAKTYDAAAQAILGSHGAIEKFKQQQKELEESDRRNVDTRKREEENRRRDASNALLDERSGGDKAAQERFKQARLRALGKDESQLTATERKKLANDAAMAGFNVSMAGKMGAGEAGRAIEGIVGGEERAADAAEIGRLKGKKNKTGSEKKRLAALTKTYDLETGKTGGKKAKDDAFDEGRKKEIDDLVRKAELEAGDQALASGNASGASEAARSAGKSTRARLEEQARKGALPGEVERSLMRVAGFEDVKNTPPPPVVVTNVGPVTFTVHAPIELMVQTGDNPESIAQDVSTHLDTILERDILPKAASSLFTALKR